MSLLTRRRALLSAKGDNLLPSAYQRVEYLESTGTQYIDTRMQGTEKIKVELTAKCIGEQSAINIFGARPVPLGATDAFIIVIFQSNGKIGFFFNGLSISAIPYDNEFHDYELGNGIYKIDGVSYGNAKVGTFNTYFNMSLFGCKDNILPNLKPQIIKKCTIYENNILIRDYIPCYRKADNKAGLYDLVNGEFYTNQGTGEFILGGEV